MAEMQFDIIIILAKHKYPPVGENYDEVYKKVLEQAENFKKYSNDVYDRVAPVIKYDFGQQQVRKVADDNYKYNS